MQFPLQIPAFTPGGCLTMLAAEVQKAAAHLPELAQNLPALWPKAKAAARAQAIAMLRARVVATVTKKIKVDPTDLNMVLQVLEPKQYVTIMTGQVDFDELRLRLAAEGFEIDVPAFAAGMESQLRTGVEFVLHKALRLPKDAAAQLAAPFDVAELKALMRGDLSLAFDFGSLHEKAKAKGLELPWDALEAKLKPLIEKKLTSGIKAALKVEAEAARSVVAVLDFELMSGVLKDPLGALNPTALQAKAKAKGVDFNFESLLTPLREKVEYSAAALLEAKFHLPVSLGVSLLSLLSLEELKGLLKGQFTVLLDLDTLEARADAKNLVVDFSQVEDALAAGGRLFVAQVLAQSLHLRHAEAHLVCSLLNFKQLRAMMDAGADFFTLFDVKAWKAKAEVKGINIDWGHVEEKLAVKVGAVLLPVVQAKDPEIPDDVFEAVEPAVAVQLLAFCPGGKGGEKPEGLPPQLAAALGTDALAPGGFQFAIDLTPPPQPSGKTIARLAYTLLITAIVLIVYTFVTIQTECEICAAKVQ